MCDTDKGRCCCGDMPKVVKKVKPKKCTPEKIKECHGDAEKHPCEDKKACEEE